MMIRKHTCLVFNTGQKDEFISYMKIRSKSENLKVIPSDKEASEAFEKLDTDDDEMLSLEEMMGMFDEVKREQEKRIKEAFRSFDKDADGFLAEVRSSTDNISLSCLFIIFKR